MPKNYILTLFVLSLLFVAGLFGANKDVSADLYCGAGNTCQDGVTRSFSYVQDCTYSEGSGICIDVMGTSSGTCRSVANRNGSPDCGFGHTANSCDRNAIEACPRTASLSWYDCCTGGEGGGCGDDLYPRCQDGSCGANRSCKQDGTGCKCLDTTCNNDPGPDPVGTHDGWQGIVDQAQCRAGGWAHDESKSRKMLTVRVLVDGVEVAQALADDYRDDLDARDDCGAQKNGECAFNINLWPLVTKNVNHEIIVQARGLDDCGNSTGWHDLGNTPRTLRCNGPIPTIPPTPIPTIPPLCNWCAQINGDCGEGSCAEDERLQTTTCDPADPAICPQHDSTQCPPDPSCVPPGTPVPTEPPNTPVPTEPPPPCGCDSGFTCWPNTLNVGDSALCTLTRGACFGGASWGAGVNFWSSNSSIASVNPSSDANPAYNTTATCNADGSVTLTGSSPVGSCGDESSDSPTTGLTCEALPLCTAPGKPNLTATCDGDGNVDIGCSWSSVANATEYRAQIDNENGFSFPRLREYLGGSNSISVSGQPTGPTYYCKARVTDSNPLCDLPSDWSSTGSFKVPLGYCAACELNYKAIPDIYPGQTLTPSLDIIQDPLNSITRMEFSVDDNTKAATCDIAEVDCDSADPDPYPRTEPTWASQITGLAVGTTTLRARGYMFNVPGPGLTTECNPQASTTVNVINPPAWWQVRGGDIITTGSIESRVEGCFFPSCLDYLDVGGNPGFPDYDPGIPIYWGGIVPDVADISIYSWNASSKYVGYNTRKDLLYTYEYFKGRVESTAPIPSDINSASEIIAGGTDANGFYNVSTAGDLNINVPINIGNNKVVVFVNGNLNINNTIRLNKGRGFFLAIVRGDINVDPDLGHDPVNVDSSTPDIEGLFFANGQFKTGLSKRQLHIRGSVAAMGDGSEGVVLERDLDNNAAHPAEYFEYAPDLLFNFPPSLGEKTIRWVETAP